MAAHRPKLNRIVRPISRSVTTEKLLYCAVCGKYGCWSSGCIQDAGGEEVVGEAQQRIVLQHVFGERRHFPRPLSLRSPRYRLRTPYAFDDKVLILLPVVVLPA